MLGRAQGKALFAQECDLCHALENYTGTNFAAKWGGGTLADVYQDFALAMPPANAGGLTPATYASIVAYFASESGYPAGNRAVLPQVRDALANSEPVVSEQNAND